MVKEFRDKNQWAVILGGSSGLGLASAKKLAKHGMNICVIHRNSRADMELINKDFEEIKSEGVHFLSFNKDAVNDEKKEEIIQALLSEIGPGNVKSLIHSIAKGSLKPMHGENALQHVDFQLTLDYMALSLYSWTSALYDTKLFATDARVLAFTSEGSTRAMKNYAAVSVAKAALEALVRSIALEFGPYGIKANGILAGITDTNALRMIPGAEKLLTHAKDNSPLGRLTTPEDVANVVYLMCKDEAFWINGTVVKVDGGLHLS